MLQPALASPILPFSVTLPPLRVGADSTTSTASIAGIVAIAWLIASAVLFGKLVADVLMLRRLRRQWPVQEIDGRRIRLTTDVGPAVVGLRSMELVLPEWILSFDESLRALVLRHEEEHRAAHDPHLLIGSRIAIALMPWNPALWFASRRLRLAIELDCDARVLHAHPSPKRYGMLLLTIAQRRGTAPTALAPMLSEPTTQLERRILAMLPSRRRFVHATTVAAVLVAAGALALACSVQSDAPTASKAAPSAPRASRSPYAEFQVEKQATPMPGYPAPRYPDALRRSHVEGSVVAQFVVNADGTPDLNSFRVVKSTNKQFTNVVRQSLATMKFYPAMVGDRAVRQLVTMPFIFSLSRRDDKQRHSVR
jgi:TonB family protein